MASKETTRPAKSDKKLTAATAQIEQLTAEVKTLRKQVKTLQTESDTWRKKADKHKSRIEKLKEQTEKAIAEATSLAKKRARAKADKQVQQAIADHTRNDQAQPAPATEAPAKAEPKSATSDPSVPDDSWTVTRLRAAARAKSVPGYSRLRKDQLIAALR